MNYDNAHEEPNRPGPSPTAKHTYAKPSQEAYPDLSTPHNQQVLSLILKGQPLSVFMQDESLRYLWSLNMPSAWEVADTSRGDTAEEQTENIRVRLEELKRQVLETGQTASISGWLANRMGVSIYAQATVEPYTLPNGKRGILGKILDLTEQQVAKEALTSLTQRQEARNNQIMTDNRRLFLENERNISSISRMELEHKGRVAELLEAQTLQMAMLPRIFPDPQGFDISTYMATSVEVGGDYYDFKSDECGGFVAALGDATGHGTRAGIIVSAVKSYFQILACEKPLAEVLHLVSKGLQKMSLPQAFMGLSMLAFQNGRFRYVSAGMPPLLVYRHQQSRIEDVQINSLFLGTHMQTPYREVELDLAHGDVAIMISDGFTETRNPEGDMLPMDAIRDCLLANVPHGNQAILDGLVHLQHTFSRLDFLRDDSTAVILRRK